MLNREKSWTFDRDGDIWEARDTHTGLQYARTAPNMCK